MSPSVSMRVLSVQMGCSASVQVHTHASTQTARTKEIDKQLKLEKKTEENVIKILLLGGMESGKTTVFKQMRILHAAGFTEADMINYRYIIHGNAVDSLKQLLQAWGKLGICMDTNLTIYVKQFLQFYGTNKGENSDIELTPEIGHVMSLLWKNKAIQVCYARRWEFTLLDSAKYFLDDLYRISDPEYRPTEQDVLHCRFRTSGIHEIEFQYNQVDFRMVDVGGQKSERRKWIHVFDNTNLILFLLALSDYDQGDPEDENENRLSTNREIYRSIVSNSYFKKSSVTLFLNKKDVFEQKMTRTPLTVCFADYLGESAAEPAMTFIAEKFRRITPSYMNFYPFRTMATDTNNVKRIFASCLSDLIDRSLAL